MRAEFIRCMSQGGGAALLAAQGNAGVVQVLVWVIVLILAATAGGIIIMFVRKKMLADEAGADASESLFSELRRMRKAGEISEAEYAAARKSLAAKLAGKASGEGAAAAPGVLPPRGGGTDAAVRRAAPGFDLTGEPLPRTDRDE